MKRMLLILACTGAAASGAARTVTLDGKEVLLGEESPAKPLVEIRDLRVVTCRVKATGFPASAVAGTLVSNLPHANSTVTVTITFLDKGGRHLGKSVTAHAIAMAPPVRKPVKFKALAPAWYLPDENGKPSKGQQLRYFTTFAVVEGMQEPAKKEPAKDDPL